MQNYNHQKIEKKWQDKWEKDKVNFCDLNDKSRPKFYNLAMFYYPSGAKIHIGHGYNYTGSDVYGRFKRLNGFNVFEPMGADAFGLPAENYAIKTGVHPSQTTKQNIDYGHQQLKTLGLMYDWEKEIDTSSPEYYKWTQWLFTVLYKAGLAYRAEAPVNWCPSCKTVLANEQVVNGKCERCDTEVIQKNLKQWFFKITDYADRLLKDHKKLNWPQKTILMQKNWIGKSEGAEVEFRIPASPAGGPNSEFRIPVFTTRPDTLFGATFMVLSPEHELISKLKPQIKNWPEVEKYIKQSQKKSDLERTDLAKEKTGVELKGIKAINPVNNKEIPIWMADYVLASYGTGAIMAVPAHDERDWEFAKKYNISIIEVVKGVKGIEKKMALLIHGTGDNGNKNWFPWLKKELKSQGYEVFNPDLPNSDKPDLKAWLSELEKYKGTLNENSIIIGHSLGCPAALHLVASLKNRISKLILVAPTHRNMPWKKLLKDHSDDPVKEIKKVSTEKIDFKQVEKNCDEIVGFFSTDDPYIPLEVSDEFKKDLSKIKIIKLNNRKHFSSGSINQEEFAEILDSISSLSEVYIGEGVAINSGKFDGLTTQEFKQKITTWLEEKNLGKKAINYKLRDWLISRQRYWGAPIPIIFCEKCGEVAVPEKDLPVELPKLKDFKPTKEGESPLARSQDFVNTKCPKCGNPAERSTETMDTFVCSSWYFLRFLNPHLNDKPFDKKIAKQWLPVDQYCGGAEHACLHLLYARFITKVLHDQGYINFDEPFTKLNHQGMILSEDGSKMSKSKGNIVIPDDYIKKYGADVFRLYVLFLAPFEDGGAWNDKGIMGVKRFIDKVWGLQSKIKSLKLNQKSKVESKVENQPQAIQASSDSSVKLVHQTIKKITKDIENFKFNTAISALMILVNELTKQKQLSRPRAGQPLAEIINYQLSIILLSPFAPHIAEELWEKLGNKGSIFKQSWPKYDKKLIQENEIELVIQINGKVRDKIKAAVDIDESGAVSLTRKSQKVKKWIKDKEIKKIIFIKGKLLNIVI